MLLLLLLRVRMCCAGVQALSDGILNVVDLGAGFGLSTFKIAHMMMHSSLAGTERMLHAVDMWDGPYAVALLEAAGAPPKVTEAYVRAYA